MDPLCQVAVFSIIFLDDGVAGIGFLMDKSTLNCDIYGCCIKQDRNTEINQQLSLHLLHFPLENKYV